MSLLYLWLDQATVHGHYMQTFYMYTDTHENRIQTHFGLPHLHLSESLVKKERMYIVKKDENVKAKQPTILKMKH